MHAARIQTSIHYTPIHLFSYYRQEFGEVSLPMTEDAAAHEMTLPLYPTMGEESVKAVIAALIQAKQCEMAGSRC